ncbi:MAG TPA: ribonuclease HI [Anaerolineales bacterium]
MAGFSTTPEEAQDLPQVTIYTDGACDPNPGPGGWAALLRSGTNEKVLTGSAPDTTNNRMELTAAIEAFKALKRPCRVDIFTDSEYLKRGINEWLPGWRARGWRRKHGALANQELWQELDRSLKTHQVKWHWVRGHTGQPQNEQVDKLARQAAQRAGKEA